MPSAFLTRCRLDPSVAVMLSMDPDYPIHPGWRSTLAKLTNLQPAALDMLGNSSGPWPLHPNARTCACLACLDMAESPADQYREDLWNQSTLTTCVSHGLPLVEVPAVGWGWADLPAAHRRRRRTFMETPMVSKQALVESWSRVEQAYQTAVVFAELTCWAEATHNQRILECLRYRPHGSRPVWMDLLTLLCASWLPHAAPSVATLGIPAHQMGDNANSRLGGKNRSILLEAPTFDLFRAIANPAERRACILIAWDAIRPIDSMQMIPRNPHSTFGWLQAVKLMPDSAWTWLEMRATGWADNWQSRVLEWRRERVRTTRIREAHWRRKMG